MTDSDFDPVDVVIPCWTETANHLGEALRSLRPYMRPIVVFNGPGAREVSGAWFEDTAWDDVFPKFGFVSDDYIATLGGGCYLCHARNSGVDLATSTYVTFLDADDFFLDGIDDVVLAARGRRGAWGDFLVANDALDRPTSQATHGQPRTGTFVVRRDALPLFDVWAAHQVTNKGRLYNGLWWDALTLADMKHVPVQAMVYRHQWSPKQATEQYWAHQGFMGIPQPSGVL